MKDNLKELGWDMQELADQRDREDISQSLFRNKSREIAEQYANQRVIEELESIEDIINSENSGWNSQQRLQDILDLIKELKQ